MYNLLKSGIFLFVLGFVAWYYEDAGNTLPLTPHLDTFLFALSAVPITIFATVYLVGLISGTATKTKRKNRCIRCGKKIPKGEIYCEYHKIEVEKEYRKKQTEG